MEWLNGVGAFLSGASGGVVGGLFGIAGKYFQRKQEMEAQEKERRHEIALLELQSKTRSQETEQEIEVAREDGRWRGLEQSLKADAATGPLPTWVLAARSLARLAFTVLLGGLTLWIWVDLMAAVTAPPGASSLAAAIPPDAAAGLLNYIVCSIVFAFSTAVAWWFGDRALSPPGHKHR